MAVYKIPGSPFWWVEFELKGKRIRESTGLPHKSTSKTAAKAEEAEIKKRQRDLLKHGETTKMTLLEAFERYDSTVIKHGTSNGKNFGHASRRILQGLGATTILDNITDRMVADWRDGMLARGRKHVAKGNKYATLSTSRTKGLKPSSVNVYVKLLRTVMRKAHYEWHALERLPLLRGVKEPKVNGKHRKPPRMITVEEEQRLMAPAPFYLRQYLTFLLGTGARKTEAVTLTWDQIDNLDLDPKCPGTGSFGPPVDDAGQPYARVRFEHVPEDGRRTKGGTWRDVPLPEHVRLMLIAMKRAQPLNGYKGNRVFLGRDRGGRMWAEVTAMDPPFVNARHKAGLDAPVAGERISLHSMRHTYASRLVMEGVALDRVRDLMGHESVEMTEIYACHAPTTLVTAVQRLDKYAPRARLKVAA